MAAPGKKRTRQQRSGESAEQAFAQFANDHGLIPAKPPDYGLDFLCQLSDEQDGRGTCRILGDVVGVLVRSAEARRPRFRLTRDDAARIVQSRIPVILVLPHRLRRGGAWSILTKAVDQPFILRLATFIEDGRKSLSLPPSEFKPEGRFRDELERCLPPHYAETLAITLAEHRLKGLLPNAAVTVVRRSAEQFSVVEIDDYLSQFKIETEADWLEIHRGAVSSPGLISTLAKSFGMKAEVLGALRSLPQPVMIGGPCPMPEFGRRLLYARDETGSVAECEFAATAFGIHTSYTHASGFSLRISEAIPQGGQHVHVIRAECGSPFDLRQHKDLLAFLRHCLPSGTWSFRASGEGIPVDHSGELPQFGIYVSDLERFDPERAMDALWLIGHPPRLEDAFMLALVTVVRDEPFRLGFELTTHSLEDHVEFAVPLVGNVGGQVLVTWLDCHGLLLRTPDHIVGLSIEGVRAVHLEWRSGRVAESDQPLLVVRPEWPTIAIGVDGRAHQGPRAIKGFTDLGLRLRSDAPAPTNGTATSPES